MVQGQVFLKEGGGGAGIIAIPFFQNLSFLHFAKLCYAFEGKIFVSVTMVL